MEIKEILFLIFIIMITFVWGRYGRSSMWNKDRDRRMNANIKVINAGKCMMCGREICIVTKRSNNKFPNIFFCPRCERKAKKAKLTDKTESE